MKVYELAKRYGFSSSSVIQRLTMLYPKFDENEARTDWKTNDEVSELQLATVVGALKKTMDEDLAVFEVQQLEQATERVKSSRHKNDLFTDLGLLDGIEETVKHKLGKEAVWDKYVNDEIGVKEEELSKVQERIDSLKEMYTAHKEKTEAAKERLYTLNALIETISKDTFRHFFG